MFAFRIHQFVSRGDTVYASPEPEATRHITLHGQQFVPDDRNKVLLPLAFCRECGQDTIPCGVLKAGIEARFGLCPETSQTGLPRKTQMPDTFTSARKTHGQKRVQTNLSGAYPMTGSMRRVVLYEAEKTISLRHSVYSKRRTEWRWNTILVRSSPVPFLSELHGVLWVPPAQRFPEALCSG